MMKILGFCVKHSTTLVTLLTLSAADNWRFSLTSVALELDMMMQVMMQVMGTIFKDINNSELCMSDTATFQTVNYQILNLNFEQF